MPKLTSRQIVILSLMLVAVLYGAYDFFAGSRSGKKMSTVSSSNTSADVSAFISEITVALSKDTPSPVDAQMINRAERQWTRDPFYERTNDRSLFAASDPSLTTGGSAPPSAGKPRFIYTGFVDTGHKKIAVINGNEYANGDALDVEGYVLNSIFPNKVLIYNKETRRTLDVPLQE